MLTPAHIAFHHIADRKCTLTERAVLQSATVATRTRYLRIAYITAIGRRVPDR